MPPARRSSPILLVVLASLYSPLAAGASLPGELIRLRDFWWPLGLMLAIGLGSYACWRAFGAHAEKAALGAVTVVLAYSWFGWAVTVSDGFDPMMLALSLVGIGCLLIGMATTHRRRPLLLAFLLRMALVLVLWNTAGIAWALGHAGRVPAPRVAANIAAPTTPSREAPDIYLILLDKYTGSAVLRTQYGFDNGAFETALRQRGFVVPAHPRPNYTHTFLTLGSMLNVRYVDDLTRWLGASSEWGPGYPLIENNRVMAFLHGRGYQVVTFPTEFGGTRQNRYADLQLPAPKDVRPEVEAVWSRQTATPVLWSLWSRLTGGEMEVLPYLPSSPALMDWRFQVLGRLPDASAHPLFVFAHLLTPHEPYIYDARCQPRPSFWPLTDEAQGVVARAYVAQIQCVNAKLLVAVDTILALSRTPPIILLQGDHGHGRLGRLLPNWGDASPAAREDRTSVFAAYLLPRLPADSVPADISPVNLMRLVLRQYFGADLPSLPEATYWSAAGHPYIFTRVH